MKRDEISQQVDEKVDSFGKFEKTFWTRESRNFGGLLGDLTGRAKTFEIASVGCMYSLCFDNLKQITFNSYSDPFTV